MSDLRDGNDTQLSDAIRSELTESRVHHPMPQQSVSLIAREVIARLSQRLVVDVTHLDRPSKAQIDAFCDALICADDERAARHIDDLLSEGATLNTIYLGYIAGAALCLGTRWENDESTFVEMTIASGRMYSIMRTLRRRIAPPLPDNTRHAFFASVPGESHTLGVTMAADLFRRRGWEIDVATGQSHDELVDQIARSPHQFVGLSASRGHKLVELARLIVDLRVHKPHAFIMVSGHISELSPSIEDLLDADFIAHDAPSAILEMEQVRQLWEARA